MRKMSHGVVSNLTTHVVTRELGFDQSSAVLEFTLNYVDLALLNESCQQVPRFLAEDVGHSA